MGDSITKPEYWLVVLGFFLILSFALFKFGTDLNSSQEITLDEDSQTYLGNYSALISQAGISERAGYQIDDEDKQNPLQKALGSIIDIFDVFGIFTLLKNVFVGMWNFMVLAFNLPSFMVSTLFGSNVLPFKFIINIISYILTLGATIMIVRLVK